MTANRPANVEEFIQRIRELETLGVASRVVPPTGHGPMAPPWTPSVAPPAAPTTTPPVAPFGNQVVNQLTAQLNKMMIGSRGTGGGGGGGDRGGRSGGDRGGGGWVDPSKRKCYSCDAIGHIARHCPAKSGKEPTGS
ncbi:guanyl-specific ribonuclease pgl-1-like [Daphnia pulicaria]|uniref:guanyl-specific ribonuclease pgl-1-like n=1 Tax=Daphnia pulicaria TaxID=35523 RepID=UPI001EEB5529|nr:guanyl-specific ribonuclease pgl-1-like [Daphnia pulicaria]